MQSLPGTSLTEATLAQGDTLQIYYQVRASYRWDAGVAMGRYLEGLKAGVLLGVYCRGCERTMVPPRAFCELCFISVQRWVELPGTGTVNTFSVSYVNWDATRRATPQVPAVIEIEGASEGMGIMHLLGEVGDQLDDILSKVKVGARVEAVWKPADEREGSITDIRHFRPTG